MERGVGEEYQCGLQVMYVSFVEPYIWMNYHNFLSSCK